MEDKILKELIDNKEDLEKINGLVRDLTKDEIFCLLCDVVDFLKEKFSET